MTTLVFRLRPTTYRTRWVVLLNSETWLSNLFQKMEYSSRSILKEAMTMVCLFLWWWSILKDRSQSFRSLFWIVLILKHTLEWVKLSENSRKKDFWFLDQAHLCMEVSSRKAVQKEANNLMWSYQNKSWKVTQKDNYWTFVKIGDLYLIPSYSILDKSI